MLSWYNMHFNFSYYMWSWLPSIFMVYQCLFCPIFLCCCLLYLFWLLSLIFLAELACELQLFFLFCNLFFNLHTVFSKNSLLFCMCKLTELQFCGFCWCFMVRKSFSFPHYELIPLKFFSILIFMSSHI